MAKPTISLTPKPKNGTLYLTKKVDHSIPPVNMTDQMIQLNQKVRIPFNKKNVTA